ncbi:energy transducer TonB [Hymenobacter sp. M29]|uniref:Energy transducer TonB n=1 Tax=Hymenobacter mellowenesis TaxID=3063995 RepID=A0ABT9A7T3_9BACT|nr:energy transducer TonB [Hymenobacter sp. M29]MDO7845419.1 energy transducer TonB [Hymenobacter sp. M29]
MNNPLPTLYSLVLSALFLLIAPAMAQTAPAAPPAEKVYTIVEQMPELHGGGGSLAIVTYIQQRVRYPYQAMRARAEGRVFVSFTVAASGLVEDVAVAKGFRRDCDSAVVAAVKQLPRFEPGRQAGQAVPVRFTIPVTFRQLGLVASAAAPDSARVYTYVEHMPLYQGEEGTKKLAKDLSREFNAASAASGCAPPDFRVFVTLTIGPSGTIYDVKSLNNQALPPASDEHKGAQADGRGQTAHRSLTLLPAACEQALVAAAQKLPRLKPGTQNGRRVAVNLVMQLN